MTYTFPGRLPVSAVMPALDRRQRLIIFAVLFAFNVLLIAFAVYACVLELILRQLRDGHGVERLRSING
jgi:hypothetical protein